MIRRGLSLAVWPDPDRIAGPQPPQTGTFSMVETTRNAVITAYGRWLGFLAAWEPPALAQDPVQRLTSDRPAGYLDHLAQTAGSRTAGR
jgi:hypothetical protein